MSTYPKIMRIRFSLRRLIIAATLAALVFSWVANQLNWIRQRREIITNSTYRASYGSCSLIFPSGPKFNWKSRTAPWQIRVFGEQGYTIIWTPVSEKLQERFGDEFPILIDDPRLYPEERKAMERASRLFPEAEIFPEIFPETRSYRFFGYYLRSLPVDDLAGV